MCCLQLTSIRSLAGPFVLGKSSVESKEAVSFSPAQRLQTRTRALNALAGIRHLGSAFPGLAGSLKRLFRAEVHETRRGDKVRLMR